MRACWFSPLLIHILLMAVGWLTKCRSLSSQVSKGSSTGNSKVTWYDNASSEGRSNHRRKERQASPFFFFVPTFAATFDNRIPRSVTGEMHGLTRASPRGYVTVRLRTQAVHFHKSWRKNGPCFFFFFFFLSFSVHRLRLCRPGRKNDHGHLPPHFTRDVRRRVSSFVISSDPCFFW